MISFAQRGEDLVLMRAFTGVSDGFYVDVGAFDPVVDSVTKAFYDLGWSGINIDPQPDRMAGFESARPRDLNLGVAASDADGSATLCLTRYAALSTLNPDLIDPAIPDYAIVGRIDVPTRRLSDILDVHAACRPIHFLKIDVEGHEPAVLRGTDLTRHRPMVLVVESTSPATNAPTWGVWEPMVFGAGYRFAMFDGLNRFYTASERSDLLARLSWAADGMGKS
jgi:FkbM family methyltransferase